MVTVKDYFKKMSVCVFIGALLVSCSTPAVNEGDTETNSISDETEVDSVSILMPSNLADAYTTVDVSSASSSILHSLDLSMPSGVYAEPFELIVSSQAEGQILYTMDGSDPATSETAVLYEDGIMITDRAEDENVVSAVDPVLFSANYSVVGEEGYHFESTVSAPEDSAVDKCTALRLVQQYEDGSYSRETNAVYYIGTPEEHIQGLAASCEAAGHSLAVISLIVDYHDLFDQATGIYVKGDAFAEDLANYISENGKLKDTETARALDANYKMRGRDWERRAEMTMLEMSPDGAVEVLSQGCGIRIQGNYSRSDLQKGFRLYARSDYGEKKFAYPVFGDGYVNDAGEKMDRFDTLTLRAGGNCAFTSKFNDTYWQSLVDGSACDIQRSRPCVVYLNGEYWGLYVLQEDYTNDYFADKHGVKKKDVVVYKGDAETYASGYKLDEGNLPEGESEDYYYRELYEFFKTHKDLSEEQDYQEFIKLVDPQSVMDYFAIECWINNKWDWPGKNWSMWRTASVDPELPYADGRWRLVFYDVEFGGVSGASDATVNTIKEDNYKPKGLLDRNTNNPAVLMFAWLMTNDGFRDAFCARLTGLSEGCFEKDTALERLNEFEAVYAPLYDQFYARYPGSGSTDNAVNGGYASIRCIRDFLEARERYISKMVEYCKE